MYSHGNGDQVLLQVHRFGHRAFLKPLQRLQHFGGFHCARVGDADHKASGFQSGSRAVVHRRALVRRIGILTSRGWAQHIVDRWRNAVSNRPTAPSPGHLRGFNHN